MNLIKIYIIAVIIGVVTQASGDLYAELPVSLGSGDVQRPALVSTLGITPNSYGKSLTTPSAWGSAYGSIFAGVGFDSRASYLHGPAFTNGVGDGSACVGLGIGNPVELVGLQSVLIVNDLSSFGLYGFAFQLHRNLGSANAIAVGAQNIMLSTGTDSVPSYYIVYSQGVLAEPFINRTNGTTRLHYSIGVGKGEYSEKSQYDINSGKGANGTWVFGNIAYELFNAFNVILDWNGINMNAGVSKTFYVNNIPLAVSAGALDLTSFSGDGVRFMVGIGTGITL